MVSDHDLRIPASSDENSINTTRQGCGKDVGDLESNEERECYHNWSVSSIRVILGIRDKQVDVANKGTGVANEQSSKGEDRANETILLKTLAKK